MYNDLTYTINGCLFKVHNEMKNIWPENTYEEVLESALRSQGLKVERQKEFDVFYFDKNVGRYRLDLLVEDKIIVELKVVAKILPLHKAQIISYLKGYNKPIGILANFGEKSLIHLTFPNKHPKTPLEDRFDFDKIQIPEKEKIRDLLFIANRILITMGPGYFPQIYRRAFYHELKQAKIPFKTLREIPAKFESKVFGFKEVNFFAIGDLLLSVVAIEELDKTVLSRFRNHVDYLKMKQGLIFNFNSLCLDFMYSR